MAYDLSGKRFGYYTVMHRVKNKGWLCVCICGKEQEVRTTKLVNGDSQSCGCMRGVLSNETKQSYEVFGETFEEMRIIAEKSFTARPKRFVLELCDEVDRLKETIDRMCDVLPYNHKAYRLGQDAIK